MSDPNKPIEEAWERLKPSVVHPLSSSDQVEIMRALFFAGANSTHAAIVSPPIGRSRSEQMIAINVELNAYDLDLQQKAMLAACAPEGKA